MKIQVGASTPLGYRPRGKTAIRRSRRRPEGAALNERERRIFETRRLAEEQITLAELAEEFGVSRERVRQIEVSAFEKVQNAVKHRVAAMGTPAPLQVRQLPTLSRGGETDDGRVAMGTFYGNRTTPEGRRSPGADRALARRSMHGTLRHRSGA
jgi:DNA-binding CsgD family transcriptional regulator